MKTIIPGNKWSFTTSVEKHENDKGVRLQDKQHEKISKWLSHVKQNVQKSDVVLVQSGKAWYHESVTE